MKKKRFAAVSSKELLALFDKIDADLLTRGMRISITTIGGVSIILQGFRERSTVDIDVILEQDAEVFSRFCEKYDIPVDIVTVSSTVDFNEAPKINLFQGKALKVDSVTAEDLIKLKLERFRRQDPEDVYAIIEKTMLSYEAFKALVQEMLLYFIGNPRGLLLSAMLVVEQMYPNDAEDFQILCPKWA